MNLTDARPLPIRIVPLPDESFHGYFHRVAATLQCQPTQLATLFPLVEPRGLLRGRGLLTTRRMVASIAILFNLSRDEAEDMFLMRYRDVMPGCSYLHEPPDGQAALRTSEPWTYAGPPRSCPDCLRRDPHYRPVSWHLELHSCCTRHGKRLTTDGSCQVATPEEVWRQREALAALEFPSAGRLLWMSARQEVFGRSLLDRHPPSGIEAFRRATDDPSYSADNPQRSVTAAWPSRGVANGRRPRSDREARLPLLLPRRLYEPGIADLIGDVPSWQGRRWAAATVRLWHHRLGAPGNAPIDPATSDPSGFVNFLERLTREGRSETYGSLCTAAAQQLADDPIDNRLRIDELEQGEVFRHLCFLAPEFPDRDLYGWLQAHWADNRLPMNEARISHLDALDQQHGDDWRAKCDRWLVAKRTDDVAAHSA